MEYLKAKEKFIHEWGETSTNWGINKTMGMIHALLMISENPLCLEQITNELGISKSNANLNIRSLIEWGIVYKHEELSSRREFFVAERNLWRVFTLVLEKRKKKELDPMIKLLQEANLDKVECEKTKRFQNTVNDLKSFSRKADIALENILHAESSMFMQSFLKLVR